MRDSEHEHDEPVILTVNEDALVTNRITPELPTDEWLAQRPRVVDAAQRALQKHPNALGNLRVERANLPLSSRGDLYRVGHSSDR